MNWIINKYKTLLFLLRRKKTIVMCRAFYGDEWAALALQKVEKHVHKILVVSSDKTWNGSSTQPDEIKANLSNRFLSGKYFFLKDNTPDQIEQQNNILNHIRKNHPECTHLLFLDTDEIYETNDIKKLVKLTRKISSFNKAIRVKMYTYIKKVNYRVYPLEPYKPIAILPIRDYVKFNRVRQVDTCAFYNADVFMHHFSLVRKNDKRIKDKFENRAKEFIRVENWFEKFYINFNPQIKNFHPIKGNETQWAGIEKINDDQLPSGVVEEFEKWHELD